jgi:hypothetical protein
LKEDLDNLLKIGEERATVCQEAPIFDKFLDSDDDSKPFSGCHLGLTITSTLQGRFVYWKGMEPSELLEYNSRLMAFTQELPFQEGKPLSPIAEEGEGRTVLVDYSSSREFSPQRHIYMASLHEHGVDDEPEREYDANCSRMSPPTSVRRTLLKMKTRSIEESGGSRMPSIGGTQKPAHGTHLTIETSTVPSL